MDLQAFLKVLGRTDISFFRERNTSDHINVHYSNPAPLRSLQELRRAVSASWIHAILRFPKNGLPGVAPIGAETGGGGGNRTHVLKNIRNGPYVRSSRKSLAPRSLSSGRRRASPIGSRPPIGGTTLWRTSLLLTFPPLNRHQRRNANRLSGQS